MTPVPPGLNDFARRVLLQEAGGARDAAGLSDALSRCCEALQAKLAPLVSSAGFDALLARAFRLAIRQFPFLERALAPGEPICSAASLKRAVDGRTAQDASTALTAIMANFIWLLVIFIGEHLALRKVRETWPDVLAPGSASSSEAPR